MGTRRPVSRVLCRSPKRTRRPFLWTAHCWTVLATYPDGSGRRSPVPDRSGTRRPYSVLLQAGLAMPPPSPETRCALTAPFHPYPAPKRQAVCFLWRYPWGRPRRALPAAFSPWSPDFPPSAEANSDRPAVWSAAKVGAAAGGVKPGRPTASPARPGSPPRPGAMRARSPRPRRSGWRRAARWSWRRRRAGAPLPRSRPTPWASRSRRGRR